MTTTRIFHLFWRRRPTRRVDIRLLNVLLAVALFPFVAPSAENSVSMAAGPLRVHPDNPRYFTDGTRHEDGSLRVVYLVGSHTWDNLVDMGRDDPPAPFDFNAYLDFLDKHHHNFIRLWAWDSTQWDTRANGSLGKDFIHHVAPQPWLRTGPGEALDGKPRFDLTRWNPQYFDRLRSRVKSAGQRGIYVSIMLFEGWGLLHGNLRPGTKEAWAWRSHPFHPANNVNGINGDTDSDPRTGEVHRLGNAAVNRIQAEYIRKVVDTVNDLDNVLYEVINEGGQQPWNWWVVQTLREYQQEKPQQHPIGITGHGTERLESMLASPADWISPGRADGFAEEPPAWDGQKVSLLDTDHVWGVGGTPAWVWKSFLRGHHVLFMDPYRDEVLGDPSGSSWDAMRAALGHTRRLADSLPLARMSPDEHLASTGYCLADPGQSYVVYVPAGVATTVDLSQVNGEITVAWMHPVEGTLKSSSPVAGGSKTTFQAPFEGDAVLVLRAGN